MAPKQPGELAHGFEAGMGCPPEPTIEIAFGPSGIGVGPELTKGLFEKVGTIDLEIQMFQCR